MAVVKFFFPVQLEPSKKRKEKNETGENPHIHTYISMHVHVYIFLEEQSLPVKMETFLWSKRYQEENFYMLDHNNSTMRNA